MTTDYTREYIKTALATNESLEQPDQRRANGTYDLLYALWSAHSASGQDGAQRAWRTLKIMRPDIAEYDQLPLLIHADELKNLSQPVYSLEGYAIYDLSFNVMAGPSGVGKSFVSLDIAGRIAAHRPVVYIAGEGLNGYASRWEAWKAHHQVQRAELYFYREALQVMDTVTLFAFIELIQEHKPGLVVIDTLARSAVGIDENSAREIGKFIDACDTIRKATESAILLVHHTGKDGTIRGSSALYSAADSVLSISAIDGIIHCYNDPEHGGKNKYNAAMDPQYFSLLPVQSNGFKGAVIVPAEKIITTFDDKLNTNAKAILEALDGYESLSAKALADATGISKPTLYRTMKRLLQAGHVCEESNGFQITRQGTMALEQD